MLTSPVNCVCQMNMPILNDTLIRQYRGLRLAELIVKFDFERIAFFLLKKETKNFFCINY